MSAADTLPRHHRRERHSIRVAGPPERALATAKEVRLAELPLARLLFRLRRLGATAPDGRMWDLFAANGFASFAEAGYAKMSLDLRAVADRGGCRLETETRVHLTDGSARRRFAAYWFVIRPFSGLTRRSWLRAAKRRAEA